MTVIVKVTGVPLQVPMEGVVVIVLVIGPVVVFVAVKAEMFPDPFAPNPIAVLEFDQEYVVPFPENVIAVDC